MAGLFSKVQCIYCTAETRIPFLRGWFYIKNYGVWYCQEQCVWKHGEIRHKEHLEATLLHVQQIVKLSEEQANKLKHLAEQSRIIANSARLDGDKLTAIYKQLNKADTKHDNPNELPTCNTHQPYR
jgi:hypothetical protein